MIALFGSFGAKNLSGGGKLVHNIYENPISPEGDKLFFLNLYKVYNLYILMDFYLFLLREVCTRPHGRSVKCPLVPLKNYGSNCRRGEEDRSSIEPACAPSAASSVGVKSFPPIPRTSSG
jgi:hypothetical protein